MAGGARSTMSKRSCDSLIRSTARADPRVIAQSALVASNCTMTSSKAVKSGAMRAARKVAQRSSLTPEASACPPRDNGMCRV